VSFFETQPTTHALVCSMIRTVIDWGRTRTGYVHLCRVAGNTVWSQMASDTP